MSRRVWLGNLVNIGVNSPGDKVYYFSEREHITIIAAATMYGKSVLIDILACAIAEHKPVIILDYKGEHKELKWPSGNLTGANAHSNSIPDLTIIDRPAFYISDLNKPHHWEGLGFPFTASRIVTQFARNTHKHKNNPHVFEKILDALPNDPAVMSAKRRYNAAKFMFTTPEQVATGERKRVPNFGKFMLTHPHTLINFNLQEVGQEFIGQCFAGLMLEQLEPYLPSLTPAIFVEEADVLCPELAPNEPTPLSLTTLGRFCLKSQKMGVEVFFVTQSLRNLHYQAIVNNWHTLILGHLGSEDYYYEHVKKLRWDRYNNYREFKMFSKGQWHLPVFTPRNSPIATLKRGG